MCTLCRYPCIISVDVYIYVAILVGPRGDLEILRRSLFTLKPGEDELIRTDSVEWGY